MSPFQYFTDLERFLDMDLANCKTVANFTLPAANREVAQQGLCVGRVWLPAEQAANGVAGPRVVMLRGDRVIDVSGRYSTMSALVNDTGAVAKLSSLDTAPEICSVDELLENSLFTRAASTLAQQQAPLLLAPNDILATKACGVTFVRSLLERVVEEKAKGAPEKAAAIRDFIHTAIGDDLSQIEPGSPPTVELKKRLIEEGMWSQYLEVGIGPDAEVFTKHQPMASVGFGAQIGVLPTSSWNNPEPEVVLAVSREGAIVGASLGNDVNLRDYEGRSALLLGEAKDQNGSCSIGPFIRLFDDSFSLDDVMACDVQLTVTGEDGFVTSGKNKMAEISRAPQDLVAQAIGEHHQYPDGLMLFLGTMFAPTEDRDKPGEGFTHHLGDRVEISAPLLGHLVNWVNHTNQIPRWEFGIGDLIEFLRK